MTYNPETYWSYVGQQIQKRPGDNVIAGDDNPYFAYKRSKFLRRFLDTIDFQSKTIMEVGFGPGGNLRHIATYHRPAFILGADISQTMYNIAQRNVRSYRNVKLAKIDGSHLPFDSRSVDLSFTVTVLQHVTDAAMLKALVSDICRVTRDTIVVMEDIGAHQLLDAEGPYINRTVDAYKNLFAEHGFQLRDVQFLNTKVSGRWYSFAWRVYRRVFGPHHRLERRLRQLGLTTLGGGQHHEGDQINPAGKLLIGLPLAVTRIFDDLQPVARGLAKLTFMRMPQ